MCNDERVSMKKSLESEIIINYGHKEMHAMPQQDHKTTLCLRFDSVLHHLAATRDVYLNKKKILDFMIEEFSFCAVMKIIHARSMFVNVLSL